MSKDRDSDEETTQRQAADCVAQCKLRGWEVMKVYRDTDASAYLDVVRPEYDQLIQDVQMDVYDAVVVWKLDRLARRVKEVLSFTDLLRKHGVDFVSVNDPGIDTTGPMGQFVLTIMAAVAQLESGMISMRVKRQKVEAAKAGKVSGGGNLPFGWKFEEVERPETDRAKLAQGITAKKVRVPSKKKDPKAAKAIQGVVRLFLDEGAAASGLAKDLNRAGFRTHPTSRTPDGKMFNIRNLRQLLVSPRLAGLRRYQPTGVGVDKSVFELFPGEWEPIISMADFIRLQERFGNRVVTDDEGMRLIVEGAGGKQVSRELHLLTGLVWCGRCKTERLRRMFNRKNGSRYVCRGCSGIGISADVIETYVRDEALLVLAGRRMLGHDQPEDDIEALERELSEVSERLQALMHERWLASTPMEQSDYEQARAALVDRRATLDGRLKAAREMTWGPEPSRPEFGGFEAWWDGATNDERRRVLAGAIEKIVVEPTAPEHTQGYRAHDTKFDPKQPMRGVPKRFVQDVSRRRIKITWRPEVVGPALVESEIPKRSRRRAGTPLVG